MKLKKKINFTKESLTKKLAKKKKTLKLASLKILREFFFLKKITCKFLIEKNKIENNFKLKKKP
jgi:hypothetical protein